MEAARRVSICMQVDGPMVCRRLAKSETVARLKTVMQACALVVRDTAELFLSTRGPTLLLPDSDADFNIARRSVLTRFSNQRRSDMLHWKRGLLELLRCSVRLQFAAGWLLHARSTRPGVAFHQARSQRQPYQTQ
jgi:hypothetical protein